jgi:RND family efflux transporter MFP subunit
MRPAQISKLYALIILSVALAIAGCHTKSADNEADPSESPAKATVTLGRVTRSDISQTLTLTGTAAALPNQDVRVSALVSGRVLQMYVAEGDSVKAGQILAKLDDRSYDGQLKQAEAAEEQAKANLENARLSLERNQDLFKRGIAARKDFEDAQTQNDVAAAGVKQAEATLEIARLQVSRSQIVSPLSGQVVKRFVSVGEQVDGTAAEPVVEVANLRDVEFLGNAPAMYLARLHPGEPVTVTAEALPGKNLTGHVIAISPAVDPATGLGVVRIRIPNPDGALRIGIFLSAQIPVETHTGALVVPAQAIYRDENGDPRVYVVSGDSATAVGVTLGIETKDSVELLSGVKEGDTIILTGGYGLGDKARIQTKGQ